MLAKLAIFPILSFSALAHADPLSIATLPGDTRWVIHLNADAARGSPIANILHARIAPRQADLLPKLQAIETITGINLTTGLHDVTLYSTSYDESNVCLAIHGNFNQERVVSFLKLDPEFKSDLYNDHSIMSWRDKEHDRLVYAAFVDPTHALLANNVKTVKLALDTLDTKTPSLKLTSPLAPPPIPGPPLHTPAADLAPAAGPIVWLAATDVSELPRTQKVESPFLLQIDSAAISVASADDKVTSHLIIVATSDKTAAQMATAVEGIKATFNLLSLDDHATPRVKLVAGLLQGLAITSDNKTLNADWTVGTDKIEALMDTIPQTPTPATLNAVPIKAP